MPTQDQRDVVVIMAALGASEDVMLAILRRNNVSCTTRNTLRRAFREESKQGRENSIATLGLRMVRLATTDGPHSFSACASLLRTMSAAWRIPKADDDDLHAASAAAGQEGNERVVITLPHNFRDRLPENAIVEVEAEPEPELAPGETTPAADPAPGETVG